MMSGERARESLSALLDGEAGPSEVSGACAAWRQQPGTRADWHAYALIGDVLRSDDLAIKPGHDAAFLAALRGRLAAEPVVLAPQPMVVSEAPPVAVAALNVPKRRRRWAGPFAVAAGFLAVGVVLVVTQTESPAPAAGVMAGAAGGGVQAVGLQPAYKPADDILVTVPGDRLIRDARLDRYLEAHKQVAGSSALGASAGFVRGAAADVPGR